MAGNAGHFMFAGGGFLPDPRFECILIQKQFDLTAIGNRNAGGGRADGRGRDVVQKRRFVGAHFA